jgi:short-subunit dehydrogenase
MAPTVLITGASQGIGKETAFLFARHGYNVVLAARHGDRLEAVAREIEASRHSALVIPTDVKDAGQAVRDKKSEVVVGSANLSVASQKLFPGIMQWIFRKTFKNKDFVGS